jgi:hypothetical protein
MDFLDDRIIITDKSIVDFYKNNKEINFLLINITIMDILKKLSPNINETLNSSINTKLLNMMSEMNTNFNVLKNDIQNKNNEVIIKLQEPKKDYMDDIKFLFNNNSLSINDKVNNLLEKSNDLLISKTTNLLNEVIPKHQEKQYTEPIQNICIFFKEIKQDTEKLQNYIHKDENTLKNYISETDNKFNQLFIDINKEEDKNIQKKVTKDLENFLEKINHKSKIKESMSDILLENLLNKEFNNEEIIVFNNNGPNSRIVQLNRNEKVSILFEYYKKEITHDVINNFKNNIKYEKLHRIFITQNINLSNFKNFCIETSDDCVIVFIYEFDYDIEKIKVAVEIIDHLSKQLNNLKKQNETDDKINISKTIFNDLIFEYNNYGNVKNDLLNIVKKFNIEFKEKIDKIEMPKFKSFLNIQETGLVKVCNKNFVSNCGKDFNTLRGLTNHNNSKCEICNVKYKKNQTNK